MVGRSIAGLFFAAALLVILPRTAAAQTAFQDRDSEIYSLVLDPTAPPVRFTGRVPVERLSFAAPLRVGGWEVSVAFDAAQCRMLCAYRRAPDRFGISPPSGLLAPPILRFQMPGLSAFLLDPAGLGSPHVSTLVETFQEVFYGVGPRSYQCGLVSKADPTSTDLRRISSPLYSHSTLGFTTAPLRI